VLVNSLAALLHGLDFGTIQYLKPLPSDRFGHGACAQRRPGACPRLLAARAFAS
jgi:hypothetical protein